MILKIYTIIHVVISLVAIVAGFVWVYDSLRRKNRAGWTTVFLTATAATTLTGFFFPYHGFTPALAFGVLSTLVLALTFYALAARKLAGGWRKVFILTALFAHYLNTFVLIAQSFQKIPALRALAPTQQEPPFAIAQGALLILFIVLGIFLAKSPRASSSAGG